MFDNDRRVGKPAQDEGDLRHESAGPELGRDAAVIPRDALVNKGEREAGPDAAWTSMYRANMGYPLCS